MDKDSQRSSQISRFRVALLKYRRLAGMDVDVEAAIRVEEVELDIMEKVLDKARRAAEEGIGLDALAEELWASGVIESLYKRTAEALGLRDLSSPLEAYEALVRGDYEDRASQVMFIVLQAVARAYANALLEVEGTKTILTVRCPVCGVETDIMVAEPDGSYSMVCPFCYYKWRLPGRGLVCPRCGSRDKFSLGVYMGRDERRVALLHCQECGFKARVIMDSSISREAPRSLLPLLALGADKYRPLLEGHSGEG